MAHAVTSSASKGRGMGTAPSVECEPVAQGPNCRLLPVAARRRPLTLRVVLGSQRNKISRSARPSISASGAEQHCHIRKAGWNEDMVPGTHQVAMFEVGTGVEVHFDARHHVESSLMGGMKMGTGASAGWQ